MEELAVSASTDFIDDGRFQIDKDSARDVLSSAGLAEEGSKRVVGLFVLVRDTTVGVDAVLQAIL